MQDFRNCLSIIVTFLISFASIRNACTSAAAALTVSTYVAEIIWATEEGEEPPLRLKRLMATLAVVILGKIPITATVNLEKIIRWLY